MFAGLIQMTLFLKFKFNQIDQDKLFKQFKILRKKFKLKYKINKIMSRISLLLLMMNNKNKIKSFK